MRAKDPLVEACSPRQLDLFADALAESERTRTELAVPSDRRRRGNSDLELLPAEPAKASTDPHGPRFARGGALTKPSAGGPSTRPRLSVSPDEAAAILGVSRDYFDEHVIGELRVVRRGRRILIALAELERWLDRSATRASVCRA
jgi:excisionase family DNA binding protein